MHRFFLSVLAGLWAVLLLSGLTGCVTTETADNSLSWRVQSLETGFLEFQESHRRLATRVDDGEKAVEARLAALEEAVDQLAGNKGAAAMAKPKPMSGVEPMVSEPRELGVSPEPMVMAGPESSEPKPWAEVPGEPQVSASVQDTSGAVYASQAGPQQLYKRALDLTLAGKPMQARPMFQEFLQKFPKHEMVPNALYWLGETYYAEKDYPQAILAFKDVSTKYPDHDKTSASLLKIGMSYRNVGDVDNAIFYLRTLVDEHPESEPARLARQMLQELAQ